ncbi:unnamed protein product [Allacma fusca]|uniref:CHK kinase-like domain-containing protein n=1 Tax=Allacma fusca TaxID=39272 RepID=A0A8J2PVW0_9HEXA|nr:unnamed protein product [Allacma fusca]
MYTQVLPAVKEFLDERGVSERNRFSIPFCYFGAEEEGETPEDYNFILVLEDLLASSFQVWEDGSRRSFNLNHTEVAVKQIALFHAATAAFKLHHGFNSFLEQFPKFIQHDPEDPAWDHYIKNGFKAVRDILNGPVPPGLLEHLQVLEKNLKEVMFKMAIQVNKSALNVVRHSDLHFFNVAFAYDESGECVQAKWFDFQVIIIIAFNKNINPNIYDFPLIY